MRLPEVVVGCPKAPGLDLTADVDTNSGANMTIVRVPSEVRIMVFVLPQATLDQISTNWTDRTVAEEVLCDGMDCGEVTTGLYIGDQEINDPAFLLNAIGKGLGMVPWALPADFQPGP